MMSLLATSTWDFSAVTALLTGIGAAIVSAIGTTGAEGIAVFGALVAIRVVLKSFKLFAK